MLEAFYSLLQVGCFFFCVLRGYSIWHANTVQNFCFRDVLPVYGELTVKLLEILILKLVSMEVLFVAYAFNRAISMAYVANS
jgi:hypothetical protein